MYASVARRLSPDGNIAIRIKIRRLMHDRYVHYFSILLIIAMKDTNMAALGICELGTSRTSFRAVRKL